MAVKVNETSIESLLVKNALLREEVQVSRRASEITATLVVEQFVKMEEVLHRLEENVSIEHKLRENLAVQNEYLAALHETTLGLMSHLDLNDLLQVLSSRAVHLLDTPHLFVYLAEPGTEVIELKVGLGDFKQRIGTVLRQGEGVAGKVWQTGLPLVIDDYSTWSGASKKSRYDGIHAVIGTPLKSGTQIVGVIGIASDIGSGRTFGEEEIELLNRFAQLASIALDNARLYNDIEQAKKDAETASRAKSTFLSNMSHELRTPLNAIIGYSEMLMEDAEGLGQEDFIPDLEKIRGSGKHLLALINDILDLSKIEAGKLELYLETFHISNLIEDVVSTVQPLVAQNNNTLKVNCPEDIGTMHNDLTKIRQVLFNLLSNACKFTEQGTISMDVTQDSADSIGWITFRVRDSGIGMTEEQMTKLFQEFSQADTSTGQKYGGTGLGLAISKRFCQMMGGDISVESEYGVGSTFTTRLPLKSKVPKAELKAPIEHRVEPVPEGMNIVLVIDDEHTVRDLMKRFLSKEGFWVETAPNGEEGIRLARELHPHVITLDVMMPGMDGWAVLSAIKADPELTEIPIIMLTIVDEKNLGYTLGASDYLIKPIDRDRLVTVLQKYRTAPFSSPVLVVEDDPNMRDLLRRMLKREGWKVNEAENGRVALERISETRPSVILLDLMMPEMDGFQFVNELRKRKACRSIPIVVITAKDITIEDQLRLDGYVEKILKKGMYTKEELLSEVRDLVKAAIDRGTKVKI